MREAALCQAKTWISIPEEAIKTRELEAPWCRNVYEAVTIDLGNGEAPKLVVQLASSPEFNEAYDEIINRDEGAYDISGLNIPPSAIFAAMLQADLKNNPPAPFRVDVLTDLGESLPIPTVAPPQKAAKVARIRRRRAPRELGHAIAA
jgi:hypothetical protein